MQEFLVRFRHIENYDILQTETMNNPTELIKTLKEVDCLDIDDTLYEYVSSEFVLPKFKEQLCIVNVFVIEI